MATYTGTDKRIQFLFDMVSNFAPIYSNTGTYAVGAYVIYQGVLYKCVTAVTVAEDFDPTKWAQVLVMDEIGSGGGGGSTVSITPTLSSGTKIADYSINGVGGELYAPNGGGGGQSDNYSTTEQQIGTWDGKPLYRIILPPVSLRNSAVTLRHNIGVKYYINIGGWCTVNGGTSPFAFPFYQNRWNGYCGVQSFDTNQIVFDSSWSGQNTINAYIDYTKTADYS